MKTITCLFFLISALPLCAFDWPGGTMTVPVVFRGEEVFAGWVPTSPWGSTPFLRDPVVELRDAQNDVVAEFTLTGGAMDWYSGGTRSGVASFEAAPGAYSVTTRPGQHLIRIGGEGYSGFRLSEESLGVPAPPNRTPTVTWSSAPSTASHGQSYTITATAHDADGNLAQLNVWKNSQPFAFAGGGNGTDGDSGNATSDVGPQSVTFTAQAIDADGAASVVITHIVSIAAPASASYTLSTSAGTGGSVSAGGSFAAGSTATITATPDSTHDFLSWSGDAGGSANPLGLLMDRDKSVQANFALKSFALTTSATSGGSVTPGGNYVYGTLITLSSAPDGAHRFLGWAGDASGAAPSITVFVNRALWVQAVFTDKTAQTISFAPLASQSVGGPPITLAASSSSGLPVNFSVVSGPAFMSGNQLTVTGPGAITVQASQPGDAEFLPAPGVVRTFNAIASAILKYRPVARTLLHGSGTDGTAPFVLERP